MVGPLKGMRIIELAGLGPAPFACMMLADLGAEVIRVERAGPGLQPILDPLARNRKSLACDLKAPAAVEVVKKLVATADGFVEGFRPGVVESLGLGPDVLLAANPQLAYGRMTGWGQDGPMAHAAGSDDSPKSAPSDPTYSAALKNVESNKFAEAVPLLQQFVAAREPA